MGPISGKITVYKGESWLKQTNKQKVKSLQVIWKLVKDTQVRGQSKCMPCLKQSFKKEKIDSAITREAG